MKQLYDVSAALSAGDLDRRATVYREDELGGISRCLNMVADKMQFLVDNLEANVRARTEELVANKNQLQLILDSTAEAIYGIDLNGNCTFCNRSCLKLLGYNSQEDLLGKNMHHQIHHSRRDGTPFPIDECRILRPRRKDMALPQRMKCSGGQVEPISRWNTTHTRSVRWPSCRGSDHIHGHH